MTFASALIMGNIAVYEMLGSTRLLRPYLGKTLLGWVPKKLGLVEGMPIYYAAWKAAKEATS